MGIEALTLPLLSRTPQELDYASRAAGVREFLTKPLDPIDEAVRAVQEAQDAVGRDIWASTVTNG